MFKTAGDIDNRIGFARPAFTLENKSNLPTSDVRMVLEDIAGGLDTDHVHVIVKNLRRSPSKWVVDEDPGLRQLSGWSAGARGYYRDLNSWPPYDDFPRRDKAPTDAIALVVLRVGLHGSHDERINWLARIARHEFTHHFQRLENRCKRTPGKYIRDPIEIEARAAEVGSLPWQT
jgi:hypothetical protein